ncbi:unnamed protein product, partial [marine sediment metagenome]
LETVNHGIFRLSHSDTLVSLVVEKIVKSLWCYPSTTDSFQ